MLSDICLQTKNHPQSIKDLRLEELKYQLCNKLRNGRISTSGKSISAHLKLEEADAIMTKCTFASIIYTIYLLQTKYEK